MPADSKKSTLIATSGRRKTATARVFLEEKKGDFTVNGTTFENYFSDIFNNLDWLKPFHAVGVSHPEAQFSATVKVAGSGKAAQIHAVVLAFARALCILNEENRSILRKQGLLTRDPRMVERKKPYLRKARKSPQYSKR